MKRRTHIALATAITLTFAACGSDDSGTSSTDVDTETTEPASDVDTSTGTEPADDTPTESDPADDTEPADDTPTESDPAEESIDDPGLADAAARVDAASVKPTGVGIDTPLSEKPDEGKTIQFLQCGVGVCKAIGDQHEAAAELLGWNFERIDMGTTPEEIVAAWDQVVALDPAPDGVITSGVPSVVYESQLADLAERGIPVVDYAAANEIGDNGIIADILPASDNEARGRLMADFVAVQSDCDANVLFLNVPDFPVLVIEQEAFQEQLSELCPDAPVEVSNFSATDIGAAIPAAVVSSLQANSEINWIVPSFDDMHLGVAEAIVEVGLDDQVQMVSQNGAVHAVDNILNDRIQVASIPQGPGQVGYAAIDALARHFNGDSLEPVNAELLPIWLQTKDTITDPTEPWAGAPDYAEIFADLWLVN